MCFFYFCSSFFELNFGNYLILNISFICYAVCM
ncbi:Uncharacterised protein [Plesiomonas shigelloides]|nr:Uncharacterised protein [Plesiomonas shigelloides]